MDNRIIQDEELRILKTVDILCRENGIKYYLAYGSVLGAVRHKGFIPWDTDIDIMMEISDLDKFISIAEKELPENYKLFSLSNNDEYDSFKPRVGLFSQDHYKIHIDIFPIVGIGSNKIEQKIQQKMSSVIYKIFFLKRFNSEAVHKLSSKKRIMHRIIKLFLKIIPIKALLSLYKYLATRYNVEDSEFVYNICGSYGFKEIIPKKYIDEVKYMDFEDCKFPVPGEWDLYLKHMYGDYMKPIKY